MTDSKTPQASIALAVFNHTGSTPDCFELHEHGVVCRQGDARTYTAFADIQDLCLLASGPDAACGLIDSFAYRTHAARGCFRVSACQNVSSGACRANTTGIARSSASRIEIAAPMPDAPPVTIATLSCRFKSTSRLRRSCRRRAGRARRRVRRASSCVVPQPRNRYRSSDSGFISIEKPGAVGGMYAAPRTTHGSTKCSCR